MVFLRAAIRAALLALALLLGCAVPAGAEVGIVTGTDVTEAGRGGVHRVAVERALERMGLSYRYVNLALLSERTLRPFEVIVLPSLRLSAASTEALRHYRDRGGRWVVYQSEGPPAFDEMLGIRALPSTVMPSTTPRAIIPDNRLGMPGRVSLAGGTAPRSVEAAAASFNAARWDVSYGVAALVRGPHGYYVNMAPGATVDHAELLLAMLGDLEPTVWADAVLGSRNLALDALREASARWATLRQKVEFTASQRARIEARLRNRRAELPDSSGLSAELEPDRIILAEHLATTLRIRDDALRLTYEMMPSRKGEVRGIWIAPTGRQDWDTLMRKARDAGLNTVFVRVGRGGSAIYPSEVLPTVEWARNGTDELAVALDAARRMGLSLHVWRENFDLAETPRELYDRLAAEDRLVRDAAGKQGPYLNPADPRNLELEVAAALELIRKYDVDGLHLGHPGYPDQARPMWDFGAVSRREFERGHGAVQQWPQDVSDGPRKAQYEDWERENINRFVQRMHEAVKKAKPHVRISAAVGADRGLVRAACKQDWLVWAREGWIDFLVPRNFASAVDVIAAAVEGQVSAVRGRIPVVAGLSSHEVRNPAALLSQVEAAREQGADGFVLSDMMAENIDEQLSALRAGATAEGTWPGYLAPKAVWTVEPVVERADSPWAMLQGDRVQLEARLLNVSPTRSDLKSVTAELRLEDPDGRLLQTLGALNGFSSRKFRFQAPAGRFRPVLRGNTVLADGNSRPFVLRGPLCDGVTPDELAALRAEEAPPAVSGTGRKVAVYARSQSADRILSALSDGLNIAPFLLHRLQADHLARAEVLVLPPVADVSDLSPSSIQTLRQWVANGGTLVLLDEAVGANWHPRIFPELAGADWVDSARALEVVRELGTLKPGTTLELDLGHLVRLRPANGAEVLLREAGENGAPVAVAGTSGKGRVVLYGAELGVLIRGKQSPAHELLWGLVAPQ